MDDLEKVIKIIVVGNGGVGKSSMTALYCKGVFTTTYKKTIGVDFLEKEIDLGDGESVRLMIWDTAGQEEFDALTAGYYRGAGACAIVFSTIDRASFEAVEKWRRKVEEQCGAIPIVLVQNKIDLISDAKMTAPEVEALARKLNLRLYRTCVKENVRVQDTFEYLAEQYIRRGGDTSGVSAVAAAGQYSSAPAEFTGEAKSGDALAPVAASVPAPVAASGPAETVASDEKDAPAPTVTDVPAPTYATPQVEALPPVRSARDGTIRLQDRTDKITRKKSVWSWC